MIEKSKIKNSEKRIETRLKELTEEREGLCLKLLPFQFKGLPDRICLLPKGRMFFAELKGTGCKSSKIQRWVHGKIRQLGFDVYILDTIEEVEGLFKKGITLDEILKRVSQASGIHEEALKLKTRKRKIVEARQAYMIIARLITDNSLEEIGTKVGKDHATVVYAFKNSHLTAIKNIISKTGLI